MSCCNPSLSAARRRLARGLSWLAVAGALLAALGATAPARAAFVPYSGAGNAVLFDPTSGGGGWVGAIDEFSDPAVATPLSFVSTVLFAYDAAAGTLAGTFEFTTAADLSGSLFGSVFGRTFDADPFGSGGQFEIDYQILGGSGTLAGASGFGIAFLNLDPAATDNNYSESGLLVFEVAAVPLPATPGLAALGLVALALTHQRRRRARA